MRVADPGATAAERRALGLLLEGVAINQTQLEADAYRRFRSAILRSSMSLIEPQPEADLLANVSAIVREFETYRNDSEATLEARQKEWRQVVSLLIHQLSARDKIEQKSGDLAALLVHLTTAVSSQEIQALRDTLLKFFHKSGEECVARKVEEAEEQDRSTANDNAAGLRGGGAAIEHVRAMIAQVRPGFVGLFRLSCLDVVGERFGPEGIQDCLMAVSAFLIQNMRAEDQVYHWSESSLLAVCDRKVREDILTAELNRVLARNRDFTITIGDRPIMLRIPVDLQVFPVSQFQSADDLQRLSFIRGRNERAV